MDTDAYRKKPKESPWKRGRDEEFGHRGGYYRFRENHIMEKFDERKYVNMDIDIDTKRAALKVSASVVGLVALVGEKTVFMATGTVIETSKDTDGGYLNTILTSASLMTSSRDDIKVEVRSSDESVYEGHVVAYDLHFNVALVNIRSHAPLPVATLKALDDSISIDPRKIRRCKKRFKIRRHLDSFKLSPGDMVVAIGRHTDQSALMVAPGVFSLDSCGFDCKELMKASCRISKCGIGGPLVNFYGDVIGFNFFHELFTPFLPVNIVSKCLEYFKTHRRFFRPSLGMEVANLYAARINKLEHVIQNFPNIFEGVIVEEVIQSSHADRAGILEDDVIISCDGVYVLGFLEFFRMVWGKTGGEEPLELLVIRKGSPGFLKINLVVQEARGDLPKRKKRKEASQSQDKFNSWPLPEENMNRVERIR